MKIRDMFYACDKPRTRVNVKCIFTDVKNKNGRGFSKKDIPDVQNLNFRISFTNVLKKTILLLTGSFDIIDLTELVRGITGELFKGFVKYHSLLLLLNLKNRSQ